MWQVVAVTWAQKNDFGQKIGDYETVTCKNISAIIMPFLYENLEILTPFERIDALFTYQSLLERAGLNRTIIPIQFGTIVKRKKEILILLEKNDQKFTSLLNFASDKAEFDLMGIWKGKVEDFKENIFADLSKKGFEIKPHQPINRAICFHLSILLSLREQETFADIREELNKKYGDRIDVRISEPLPPYSFFTLDLKNTGHQRSKRDNCSTAHS